MSLQVWTAQLRYHGLDRLDVTRGTADRASRRREPCPGAPFAPSWRILMPALAGLMTWPEYAEAYALEMAISQRRHRAAWQALLRRDEVTLVCFCRNPARCHRTLLAQLLAKIGATYLGERSLEPAVRGGEITDGAGSDGREAEDEA